MKFNCNKFPTALERYLYFVLIRKLKKYPFYAISFRFSAYQYHTCYFHTPPRLLSSMALRCAVKFIKLRVWSFLASPIKTHKVENSKTATHTHTICCTLYLYFSLRWKLMKAGGGYLMRQRLLQGNFNNACHIKRDINITRKNQS